MFQQWPWHFPLGAEFTAGGKSAGTLGRALRQIKPTCAGIRRRYFVERGWLERRFAAQTRSLI
jgi:hypothetical protein